MGSLYDSLHQAARLRHAEERIANLRMQLEELDDLLNQRNNELMDLRDLLAERDRRIDDLERDTWRPHH